LPEKLATIGDPRVIPTLIGVIDADNSYDTVYGIGYFALGFDKLGELTGVHYVFYHDGPWWRRWWENNKARFPKDIQEIPIPTCPRLSMAAAMFHSRGLGHAGRETSVDQGTF